jgi:cell division protein FtsN
MIRPGSEIYRVWLGPFDSPQSRDSARQQLSDAGFQAVNAAP